jgi:glycosyltransferase involved in cell wall biosynthesis
VRRRVRIAKLRATIATALEQGADAVHVECVGGPDRTDVCAAAVGAARAAGVRVVVRCFDLASAGTGEALRAADRVVVPSRPLRDELERRLGVRAAFVPALVEDSGLEPPPPRAAGRLRLVCARPLEPVHGVGLVLAAAATARADGADLELVVAGEGPEQGELARIASSTLPRRVRFVGALHREELISHLRAADVFVDAGRSDELPDAVLDALAVGLPVVSAAGPATSALVEHEATGLVTPAGDGTALAASIERFAKDRTLLVACGWRAKIGALRWTWDAVRERWAAAYAG